MEPRAHYTLVGMIIVISAVALTGGILWLSQRGLGEDSRSYAIYFHRQSSAGLQKDGTVTMRGIKVGTVRELGIPEKDIESVRVIIQVDPDTPVKVDTRAVIQRNLLTGLASIDLVGSSQDAARLITPRPGDRYATIPEGTDGLSQIQENFPEMLHEARLLLEDARKVVGEENRAALAKTLSNIEEITSTLAGQQSELAGALQNLESMANELSLLAASLREDAGGTMASIRALTEELRIESARVGGSVHVTADKLGRAAERFEDPRSALLGPRTDQRGPGE